MKEIKNLDQKFGFIEENRPISSRKVEKIKASIEKHGYLPHHRVLVVEEEDGLLTVIDGQHRIIACNELGINAPYSIFEGTRQEAMDAMVDLNTTGTNWSTDAWVNHWAKRGNYACKRVISYLENYKVGGVTNILSLATNHRKGGNVKQGDLDLLPHAAANVHFALYIKDRVNFILNRDFCDALVMVLNHPEFTELDEEKLKKNIRDMEKCGSREQYLKMFEQIINRRRREIFSVPRK